MKNLFYLCCLVILFSSCKKDEARNPFSPNNPIDTPLSIRQFIMLDTTITPADTVAVFNYAYDIHGRCNQIIQSDALSGVTYTITNYFNGLDTVIAQRKITVNTSSDVIWEKFIYGSDGKMLTDSVMYGDPATSYLEYNYSYFSDTTYSTITRSGQPYAYIKHIQHRNSIPDIDHELDSIYIYDVSTNQYEFDAEIIDVIGYDFHPDPFFRNYPKRPVTVDFNNPAAILIPNFYIHLGPANVLSQVRTVNSFTGTPIDHLQDVYSYEYLSNGYPSISYMEDQTTNYRLKGVYKYN